MSANETVIENNETTIGNIKVTWDDTNISSSYANIATATATREEFFLLLGVHQNWKGLSEDDSLKVKLTDRVVLNPFAAKRLFNVLGHSIKVYEEKFGTIEV